MTALAFVVILSLLILIHELGHFIVARLAGIKVEEFAFGFPPRVVSIKKGETRYSLNLIPIGGYVKMLGEDGGSSDHRAFSQKSVAKRLAVVVAGVTMNVLLAIVLLTIGFSIGMAPIQSTPAELGGSQKPVVIVANVLPDSPAQKAGLQTGDIIKEIRLPDTRSEVLPPNYDPVIGSVEDVQKATKLLSGKEVDVTINRSNKPLTLKADLSSGDAPLGVGLAETAIVKLSFIKAVRAATIETGKAIESIFMFVGTTLKGLFIHGKVSGDFGGPVAIYSFTGQAIKLGFTYLIQLTALLSINLAVLNILPIPALDGGRGLFIVLEGFFKRKVLREHIEGWVHTVGFALLILLLLAITARDIIRLR